MNVIWLEQVTPCEVAPQARQVPVLGQDGGSPEGAGVMRKQAVKCVAHNPPGPRYARATPPTLQGWTKL
jgi:hypothetical protein